IDPYAQAFINYASHSQLPCLEIGAAYGAVTLEALKKGATMVVNDLDPSHLEVLKNYLTQAMEPHIKFVAGKFPEDVHLNPESFGAIFSSRVIHFFTPQEIDGAFKNFVELLVPGGKLFIVCETPYLKNYKAFIPIFEDRKARGAEWPGLIEDISEYNIMRAKHLPRLMHFFDAETLSRVVSSYGFVVEKVGMFERADFPDDIQLDGRESVGIIAYKPC
ncbi:MAG: class I SAM-dependent methyltransferase, partial [Alphaproteobacteria bacterium]|nr:class I SAM-dependent methyltransferase [Alphaproteobacteria bacterium]